MNRHVNLDRQSEDFVDRQVEEGRFSSPGEVVRAGLQLLEEQQAKMERLRTAIVEGEESGPSRAFDFEAFIAHKHRERGL